MQLPTYIAEPPATSYNGISLNDANASQPLPSCRFIILIVTWLKNASIEPSLPINIKIFQVVEILISSFHWVLFILIVPHVSSQASSFGDFAWKSPFDTAPADGHPITLTNLQVSIGGQNILQSVLNYNNENFIEQLEYC